MISDLPAASVSILGIDTARSKSSTRFLALAIKMVLAPLNCGVGANPAFSVEQLY